MRERHERNTVELRSNLTSSSVLQQCARVQAAAVDRSGRDVSPRSPSTLASTAG